LVSRTRATLRSAEFGFFGVCVYTRMHTPRFSGQPINAGDFVFTRTASRPIRTNCENVGTVILFFVRLVSLAAIAHKVFIPGASSTDAQKDARLSHCAHQKHESALHAERYTAHPEKQPARNSAHTPEGRTVLLASVRRGLLGFAGLAPHSGRSSVPFPRAMFRDRRSSLPTSEPLPALGHTNQVLIALTNNEV